MKLPSIERVLAEAGRVLRRFPLPLVCAFVLCGLGCYAIFLPGREQARQPWLFPALSAAGLGLSFSLAVALAAERYRWPAWARLAGAGGVVTLLGVWYAACPPEPNLEWGLRLVVLLVALHLAVAVVPYLPELRREADTPGFWHYNETLFLRTLTSGLYSGVLFVGGVLALLAVEKLFNVKLDEHLFGYWFIGLATVFNTWFFLAGVPRDFAALEQTTTYPKGLKVFTQFVLLPLVVLYLVILYAYLGRIVLRWELPEGWVSILILAFAVASILALLLMHPIREAAENAWVRTFARWFYLALLPLLGLLAVAIGTRVRAYGITEERYFVLVLAAWLLGMALYFLVRRGQGIIWIPASLAVVALLAAGGPWGAFAVAQRSQFNQLRAISAQYGLLKDGKLDGAGARVKNIPFAARQRLTSIFEFFADRKALVRLQPLFKSSLQLPDSLRRMREWEQRGWRIQRLFAASQLDRVSPYQTKTETTWSADFSATADTYALGNGRYWLQLQEMYRYQEPRTDSVVAEVAAREGNFRLRTTQRGRTLLVQQQRADQSWQTQLTLSPGALADSLARVYGRNPGQSIEVAENLTLSAASPRLRLRLFIRTLNRFQSEEDVSYHYASQALLEVRE